jgi:hypothetical protein
VEVHSTRLTELAKACIAAFFSSFGCLTSKTMLTATLFVKRTTKASRTGSKS